MDLQYLLDRTAISETITRYFSSLDHRDWAATRETLADTIHLDFEELLGRPPSTLDSDDFVDFARRVLTQFGATQHISPNHVVSIDGDNGECRPYMYAWHLAPDDLRTGDEHADTYVLRGHYRCHMVRTPAGWRMDGLYMGVWHEGGNREVYDTALARGEQVQA